MPKKKKFNFKKFDHSNSVSGGGVSDGGVSLKSYLRNHIFEIVWLNLRINQNDDQKRRLKWSN